MQRIPREQFDSHPLLTRLLQLHKPPEEIFILGNLSDITIDEFGYATPRILTVVGSRNHTSYASDVIDHLLGSLAGMPVIIVSGLALGVDSLAHKHALKNNLPTIAIPGSGLNNRVLYPQTNTQLAKTIVEKGGALISELAPDIPAAPWTFPSRNRLMAALSDAVLIIEAKEKSGTLITARQALELGRDIGVVAGNMFSENSRGANTLVRDGAQLIASKEDLFALLKLPYTEHPTATQLHLSKEEKIIMNLLEQPMQKDTLLLHSKLPANDFLVTLSSLEMKGYIQETFGEVRKVV